MPAGWAQDMEGTLLELQTPLTEHMAVSNDTDHGGLSALINVQFNHRPWYLYKSGLQHINGVRHNSAEEVPQSIQVTVPQQGEEDSVHSRLAGDAGKQVIPPEHPVHTIQKA